MFILFNDAYFNQSLSINNVLINPQWVLIYASNGSIYGYGYSASFSGTNTVAHPYLNGKLFVCIYSLGTNAGQSFDGGMKLNPINIQRSNGNYFTSNNYFTLQIQTMTSFSNFVSIYYVNMFANW